MTTSRRRFIQIVPAAGASLLVGQAAFAQAMVDEKDPTAVALGYVADTTKVDAKKFPKHTKDQSCANCALFVAATAGCPLFAGKKVAAKGWCSAWAKKA